MDGTVVFGIEVAASLASSTVILLRLQSLMRRVGDEECERGNRGAIEFWVAYTQLMMVIAPLLLVAALSSAGAHYRLLDQVKSSLALVLVGQAGGLVMVGRAVWNAIMRSRAARPLAPAAPATPLAAA
jgi:hypothetical protein